MTRDVIIVGGGVIGCSIAWKLAQAGLKVTVIERGRIGCEASRAAAGMISPQSEASTSGPFFDLCLKSRSMYRRFAQELSEASGIDIQYRDEGTLFVVLRGQDVKEKTNWSRWQVEAGLPIQNLSLNEIHRLEPAVTESAIGAILLPEEHQVENRRLMDALTTALQRAGADLIEGSAVTGLVCRGNRVLGIQLGRNRLEAGFVVLAAGAWSSELMQPLGLNIKVFPAHGQMIAVRGSTLPIQRVIHSSSVYVVPRRDGRILIGSTVEYTGFRKTITVSAIKHLLNAAVELVPALEEFEIEETWSGLRPDTVDHLPIMGPTALDGLIFASGHFRNGILLAPVTAELIADTILQNYIPGELAPFAVERFNNTGDSSQLSRSYC